MKSKTTAKLIEKRTLIAAVRDKLGQIDTFLTPLLSGCRLPLTSPAKEVTVILLLLLAEYTVVLNELLYRSQLRSLLTLVTKKTT
jgi:hypothetical protein